MANTRGRGRGQQAQRNVNNSLNLQLHAHLADTHTHTTHTLDACNVCWMCLGQHSPLIVCIYIGMYLADTRHIYPCAYGSHSPSPPPFGRVGEWRHLMFAHIMTRPIRFCNHKPIGNTFGIRTAKKSIRTKQKTHTEFTRRCK